MANTLDDEKYQLLVDSLVANYIKEFGQPPKKDNDLDTYTEGIFSHYVNTNDKFMKFVNKIPINLSNIQILDKSGRSLFIDLRNSKKDEQATSKNESKRTIRYNGVIEPRQISETNRYAFYLLLRHDFKESAKRQSFSLALQQPAPANEKPKLDKNTASGSLEKDFKAMAIKGQATDVIAAFKKITNSMPEKDKADLSTSLKSSGIYTSSDLQRMLNRWKDEAQGQDKRPEHTQARNNTRDLSIGL
jgi:hypothetical protein